MKNSKKLFLIVLSVLIVAFISCKSNEDPESGSVPFKVSSIAGTWSGEGVSFTIDNNRNFSMNSPTSLTYQIPEADWNSEKREYTINGDDIQGEFQAQVLHLKALLLEQPQVMLDLLILVNNNNILI